MIRIGSGAALPLVGGALIVALGVGLYLSVQKSADLRDDLARERANTETVRQALDERIEGERLAWKEAERQAHLARDIEARLAEYRSGAKCDPNDPACGIGAILDLLR